MDELEDDSEEAQDLSTKLDGIKGELRDLYVALNALKLMSIEERKLALQRVIDFQASFEKSLPQKLTEDVYEDELALEILLMIHDARNCLTKLGLATEIQTAVKDAEPAIKPVLIEGLRETYRHLIVLSHNHVLGRAFKMVTSLNAGVVTLENNLPSDLKTSMLSRRLARVLHNLIQNSKKALECVKAQDREWKIPNHTRLSIQIEVSLNGNFVEILVTDNGPGLLERDPFAGSTQEDGRVHGVGLTTSRKLCRAAGGDLTALPDAETGGARFLVRIPLLKEAGAEPEGGHEE